MNRVLSALSLDIHFAGAAQQKYPINLRFVPIFRLELLLCGAMPGAAAERRKGGCT
ncbi:hypothetical protein [Marivita sp.]|uniref:hypothetical protein n=1 Tax=Marivita sp. TaxID=2003365 RepID=UPI0025C1B025|nr:hypothetical protein [Marivita sp.]